MPAALEPTLPCVPRGGAGEGTGRSTFRASGGTGLLLNASLQRARTNGLLTERRRCSLTRRNERQAELEICSPLLKSARGGNCTRGDQTGCAQSRGVGQTPRTLGPHTMRFPARRPGRGAHTLRASRQPSAPLVLFLVQWSLAVHWEEQRAGEDSETHIQPHRDDLAPGSRLREQTCTLLL